MKLTHEDSEIADGLWTFETVWALRRVRIDSDGNDAIEIKETEMERATHGASFGAVRWATQLIVGTNDTDHPGAVY